MMLSGPINNISRVDANRPNINNIDSSKRSSSRHAVNVYQPETIILRLESINFAVKQCIWTKK